MARSVPALLDRLLIWIAYSSILALLYFIRSELKQLESPMCFREIYVEKANAGHAICPTSFKSLPKFENYLTTKYHTVVYGGGLGNQLFELLSIIGIASQLGRTPLLAATDATLMKGIVNGILYKFPLLVEQFAVKITEPSPFYGIVFNQRDCCRYENISKLEVYNISQLLFLEGYYYQSYKYFNHLRPSIRDWLTPLPNVAKKAEQHLPEDYKQDFILCTHIRRGDFTDDGVHMPSDANFTRQATDYLARKYKAQNGSVTVVVLGNDPLWAQNVFLDLITSVEGFRVLPPLYRRKNLPYKVVITSTMSPEVDLAFSRSFCDSVLITAPSSTFGWWLAYLSKPAAAIYYRDINETADKVLNEMTPEDFYPPEWAKLQKVL